MLRLRGPLVLLIVAFTVSETAMSRLEGSGLVQGPALPGTPAERAGTALGTARRTPNGRGYTYTVYCDLEAAQKIRRYCRTIDRKDTRVVASRITATIREAQR